MFPNHNILPSSIHVTPADHTPNVKLALFQVVGFTILKISVGDHFRISEIQLGSEGCSANVKQ